MDKIIPDITGIALALIGLATLTVLITNKNTATLISESSKGFGNVLSVAMGGNRIGYNF